MDAFFIQKWLKFPHIVSLVSKLGWECEINSEQTTALNRFSLNHMVAVRGKSILTFRFLFFLTVS